MKPGERLPGATLAVIVVLVVGMMVVPLPTAAIDLLLSANLALAVLVLSVALFVRDGLSFATLPTLLLLTTLYRLALNVSSTRLILLQADAGRVIDAFGSFVVQGDYVVGAVVFIILTIIQFGVIARGAERVAEVGARFTLDAMPGKQLAIEAEQRSGAMSRWTAADRRRRLDREAQFYGAMDGAMKFVKGDAIASIAITSLNLIAGIGIGSFVRGMPLADAVQTYGLLTIGDGLVSQLPALLISTAAGLVVTRVSSERAEGASLGDDLLSQLSEPRALWVAAAVALVLALIPGLPAWTFVLLGVLAAAAAYRQTSREPTTIDSDIDIIVEVDPGLGEQLQRKRSADRASEAAALAAELLGVRTPTVGLRSNDDLRAGNFRLIAADVAQRTTPFADEAQLIDAVGLQVGRSAEQWITLDDLQQRLDALADTHPALLANSVPKPFPITRLAHLVRCLVAEGVSLRWLPQILESLSRCHAEDADDSLVERVRSDLGPRITDRYVREGQLRALRLSPAAEDALVDALVETDHRMQLAIEPELAREITDAVATSSQTAGDCPLLVRASLRGPLRQLIAHRCPDLAVLCPQELSPGADVETVALIGP